MHYDKFVEPNGSISLTGSTLKWYDLAKLETPVPTEISDRARRYLEERDVSGELANFGERGFVILHRCGDSFYFLLVSTWNNENELWETVFAKQNDDQADFALFPHDGSHRATFCVWELAIVWHEQQAWRRFLLSDREHEAAEDYLNDRFRGVA